MLAEYLSVKVFDSYRNSFAKGRETNNVAIGIQSFDKLIEGKYFYIDKTSFIKEWWENGDDVTLITRPRRFGKADIQLFRYR